MTTTQTYNGWTNYETWCVNLWLTNDPVSDEALQDIVRADSNLYTRARELESLVHDWGINFNQDDGSPLSGASVFVDLLRAALDNVNWCEIVENHEHDDEF